MFKNVSEVAEKCNEYFAQCSDSNIKATVTGLALYLGFESRQSLFDYEKKEEFAYIIKRAKLAIENSYETSGQMFDIFALKNMGWRDKSEVEIPGGLSVIWQEKKNYGTKPETDDSA